MKKKFIAAIAAFISIIGFAQTQNNTFTTHTVVKGDTASKISRDNGISVTDFFSVNPEAKNGLQLGSVVLIPKGQNKTASVGQPSNGESTQGVKTHVVQPKETIFSICRFYKISVEDLYKYNPSLQSEGLRADSIIIVGNFSSTSTNEQWLDKPTTTQNNASTQSVKSVEQEPVVVGGGKYKIIVVEPKSTLYSLAKEYQTTEAELLRINPELNAGLKQGQRIAVPNIARENQVQPSVQNNVTDQYISSEGIVNFEVIVQPGETLYSIAKKYDMEMVDLIKANPSLLKEGLIYGSRLTVRADASKRPLDPAITAPALPVSQINSDVDLSRSIVRSQQKTLALFLPFNIKNLQDDFKVNFPNDAFLNMTLDFYFGAKMAVDKAKELGLPLRVDVYDSNETKNTTGVVDILKNPVLASTDVIIGPFYQHSVEATLKNLPNSDVLVVSPLSTEKLYASSQLIQTMPAPDDMKNALLGYYLNKGAKITVIVDDKRTSTKNFMAANYPAVKVISTSLVADVDKTLVSGKDNVFILDSNSIVPATTLVNKLKNKTEDFSIVVASFDKAGVFDYSEISISSLIDLKFTYASVTKEQSDNTTEKEFTLKYKSLYGENPNRFAVRGYDVTLDVILRMFQERSLASTLNRASTEVENKFSYVKSSGGVIQNKAVYLLQYTPEMTTKVIN